MQEALVDRLSRIVELHLSGEHVPYEDVKFGEYIQRCIKAYDQAQRRQG